MSHLIQIGNSQGVRIPKPYIEQAKLEGKELEMRIVDQGLLITPAKEPRSDWKQKIEEALSASTEVEIDSEWLDADLDSGDEEWEW